MKTRMIHKCLYVALCLLFAAYSGSFSVSGQQTNQRNDLFPNTSAYIVVTGIRLNEDPKNFYKDYSVAEGAKVKVTMINGPTKEKNTEKFSSLKNSPEIFFTADFKIEFDSTYTVEMTFKDGTRIVVDNYKILPEWKTHFYFHSTNGTKSPATIMRRQEDKDTNFNCLIYGLYPFKNYKAMGGTQLGD